jgi:hypothetical protein
MRMRMRRRVHSGAEDIVVDRVERVDKRRVYSHRLCERVEMYVLGTEGEREYWGRGKKEGR